MIFPKNRSAKLCSNFLKGRAVKESGGLGRLGPTIGGQLVLAQIKLKADLFPRKRSTNRCVASIETNKQKEAIAAKAIRMCRRSSALR